jgi:hypothetical protein
LEQADAPHAEGERHPSSRPRKKGQITAQNDVVDGKPREKRHGKGQQDVQQDEAGTQGAFLPVPPEKRVMPAQGWADAGIGLSAGDPVRLRLSREPAAEIINPGLHYCPIN